MYRAVVLTTLVLLLLAVAGVSVAQDGRIFAGEPNSADPPESTSRERTSLEATRLEDTTTSPPPGTSSEAEDHQNITEPPDATEPPVVTEPTVGETGKPPAAAAIEEKPPPGPKAVVSKPGDSGSAVGRPSHAGEEAPNVGGPPVEVGPQGNVEPEGRGNEVEPGRSAGQPKAVLCHKANNKTLTVGAPALGAHLRHGDTRGACQGGVSGSEPPGETMGPEAATNGAGGGGGPGKVVLCHKGKTLTVGAGAQEAHLRHGDDLGACP